MPEKEVSSPNEEAGAGAGAEAVNGGTPPVDGSAATTEKWFCDMRGWIMMVAAQVAAFTYQAGLSPPNRFSKSEEEEKSKGSSDNTEESTTNYLRYNVFFYSNTMVFMTSLAIIVLLMNRSVYCSFARVKVLEIIVVLNMIGLMAGYWAGSKSEKQFAPMLTALVLFVVHAVYTVQLVHTLYQYAKKLVLKLVRNKLWSRFVVVRRPMLAVPARAATRDDDDGTPPVPNQQDIVDDGTRAPPTLDIGRTNPEMRRRDSRLLQRTPGKSAMQSP